MAGPATTCRKRTSTKRDVDIKEIVWPIIKKAELGPEIQANRDLGVQPDLRCGICKKYFNQRSSLQRHVDIIHSVIRYPCNLCDKVCSSRETLTYHYKEHVYGNQYSCLCCGKSFTKKANLRQHLETKKCQKAREEHNYQQQFSESKCKEETQNDVVNPLDMTKVIVADPTKCNSETIHTAFEEETEGSSVPWEMDSQIVTYEEAENRLLSDEGLNSLFNVDDFFATFDAANSKDIDASPTTVSSADTNTSEVHLYENEVCGESAANEIINPTSPTVVAASNKDTDNVPNGNINSMEIHENEVSGGNVETEIMNPCGSKQFLCPECGRNFNIKRNLARHRATVHKIGESFPCTTCGKVYWDKHEFKFHVAKHEQKFRFTCQECDKGFMKEYLYQKHLRSCRNHKKSRPSGLNRCFLCPECGRSFNKHQNWKRHRAQIHHIGESFPCTTCGKVYWDKLEFKYHVAKHEQKCKFTCKECNKGYNRECEYLYHVSTHSEKFHCNKCDKTFSARLHFESHVKELHAGLHACHLCDKAFKHSLTLKYHVKSHEGNYSFKCSFCDKGFLSKDSFLKHEDGHHEQKGLEFVCSICDRRFSTLFLRTKHINGVHKKKSFPCDRCEKVFKESTHLRYHQQTHDGDYRFKCGECGKGFSIMSRYKDHPCMFIGKEPSIECAFCDKKFHTARALSAHSSQHNKKHQCSHCGAMFGTKSEHERHVESQHQKIKHACHICPKSFASPIHLRYHVEEHAGIFRHRCKVCGKGYNFLNNCRSHERRCKGDKKTQ